MLPHKQQHTGNSQDILILIHDSVIVMIRTSHWINIVF